MPMPLISWSDIFLSKDIEQDGVLSWTQSRHRAGDARDVSAAACHSVCFPEQPFNGHPKERGTESDRKTDKEVNYWKESEKKRIDPWEYSQSSSRQSQTEVPCHQLAHWEVQIGLTDWYSMLFKLTNWYSVLFNQNYPKEQTVLSRWVTHPFTSLGLCPSTAGCSPPPMSSMVVI